MEIDILNRARRNNKLIIIAGVLLLLALIVADKPSQEQAELSSDKKVKRYPSEYTVDDNYSELENVALQRNAEEKDSIAEELVTEDISPPVDPKAISPTSTIEKDAVSASVKTYDFNELVDDVYSVILDESDYSNLAFRWDFGDLFIWEEDKWVKIERDTEGIPSSTERISEIIYGIGPRITFKTEGIRTLSIDVLGIPNPSTSIVKTKEIVNSNSGAKYSTLNIISRDQWGASPISWDPNSNRDIDDPARFTWMPGYYRASRFVIHHTASPINTVDPAQAVRDIYLYHAYSRGWGDIGYNYIIDQNGNIYEGKAGGDEVYGYHAYTEANTMSIGIALIGDYQFNPPSQAMKDALVRLLAEKSVFYGMNMRTSTGTLSDWLDTNVNVFGHNESYFWCTSSHPLSYLCPSGSKWVVNSTACPGNGIKSILATEIVPQATNYARYNFTGIKNAVLRVNEQLKNAPEGVRTFIIEYDLPEDTSEEVIRAKLPKFSGIDSYYIKKNRVVVTLGDWNDGILVPTVGWDGFYPNTFFPSSEGTKDRMRTLMKIFLLDPEISNVYLQNQYRLSPL